MTNIEKAEKVAKLLLPEVVNTQDLLPYLEITAEFIINRRFPFKDVAEAYEVPDEYENIQCQMVVELWAKRGAEGQIAHNENGINRTWASSVISPLLYKSVIPKCGSVVVGK